jgi:hypothetical protein
VHRSTGNTQHGMAGTRIWGIYISMRQRTGKHPGKNAKWYADIKCQWHSFEDFYNDMGESYLEHVARYGEKNTTIERKDFSKDYCKGNCRWATIKEQNRNSSSNRFIALKGKTQCLAAWLEELNLNKGTVYDREKRGWSIERALLQPVGVSQWR